MNIVNGEDRQVIKTPILIPYEPDEFWATIRHVIKEEVEKVLSVVESTKGSPNKLLYEIPGLAQKPLYKIAEICSLFQITKPTVYEWCRVGKLKPIKIRSRVFFLRQNIDDLLKSASG